jgi:hypothetical protein
MLGVALAVSICLATFTACLKTGAARCNRSECHYLQKCLESGTFETDAASGACNPERLVGDLRSARNEPDHVVNLINQTLSDIDYETRGTRESFQACSRISVTAGMAGACIEIALRVQSSSLQAVVLGAVAVTAGIIGAASCAAMGHWAARGTLLRRRLWDDFVRSILKSEFPQTAWSVRASGLKPTNVGQNGQDL